MPVAKTTKRATAAPAKAARPTIAGLQRELREAQAAHQDSLNRWGQEVNELNRKWDASWAHFARLRKAIGGEQGDRRAETREELLGWAVDDAITLIERGKAAEAQAREWREKYEKAAESLAMAEENMRLNEDEYERVCNLVRQHERERAESIAELEKAHEDARILSASLSAAKNERDTETRLKESAREAHSSCLRLVEKHERERAACWGCRLTRWLRGLRG